MPTSGQWCVGYKNAGGRLSVTNSWDWIMSHQELIMHSSSSQVLPCIIITPILLLLATAHLLCINISGASYRKHLNFWPTLQAF